jgi:hypothetical protein
MNIVGSGSSSMISFSGALKGVENFKNFFEFRFKYFHEQIKQTIEKNSKFLKVCCKSYFLLKFSILFLASRSIYCKILSLNHKNEFSPRRREFFIPI